MPSKLLTLYLLELLYVKNKEKIILDTVVVEDSHDIVISAKDKKSGAAFKVVEHTVQKGESLYAIAKEFNVTVSDLVEWNEL